MQHNGPHCFCLGVYDFIVNNITAIHDNDVIFTMDALDIWLQQSPSALLRRYEELAGGGVVIGADKGCWPNEWEGVCLQSTLSFITLLS